MNEVLSRQHRVAIGRCPECNCAIIVVNDYSVWPLVECSGCDWKGGIGGGMFEEHIIEVGQRINRLVRDRECIAARNPGAYDPHDSWGDDGLRARRAEEDDRRDDEEARFIEETSDYGR